MTGGLPNFRRSQSEGRPPIFPIVSLVSSYSKPRHLHFCLHISQTTCSLRRTPTHMLAFYRQIHNLNDLRKYVNETLCQIEQLEIGAFQVTERILMRGGRPCGIFFCLHGPRQVKITAIWETDQNTILFYGSNGERFQTTQLTAAPCLATTAA